MYLTVEQLQAKPHHLQSETVTVRWTDSQGERHSADVDVIEMTVAERSQYEKMYLKDKDDDAEIDAVRERLVIATACNAERQRIFDESHLEFLSGLGASVIEPIVNAAQKLNGMTGGDLEELGKNSKETSDSSS